MKTKFGGKILSWFLILFSGILLAGCPHTGAFNNISPGSTNDKLHVIVRSMNPVVTHVIFKCDGARYLDDLWGVGYARTSFDDLRLDGCHQITMEFLSSDQGSSVMTDYTPNIMIGIEAGETLEVVIEPEVEDTHWDLH